MSGEHSNPLEDGPPEWASSWGEDRCGIFVGFEIEGVEQILRWIPAGTFTMGSPEGEPGRWDREGPQHKVTISRGFWLGDSPVTQQLWEAVMGDNPSRFKDPLRPVEQVYFAMVEDFLGRTARYGLGLRLPTEAEWEYACRGGTEEATYGGSMATLGANNAPVLDEIAWYGGNSGVDLDLPAEQAADSSDWPEKQHPHERAATRRVKTRRRNPWGLHDMLGNVYEWCLDGASDDFEERSEGWGRVYSAQPVTDPVQLPAKRPHRVIRGGSWRDDAGRCRAAFRFAFPRESADDGLGFRVARGRAPEGQ